MRLKILLALFALLTLFAPRSFCAAHDPGDAWLTAKSPHFRFHYPERLSGEAARLLPFAEKAHAEMTRIAGWEPSDPVEVVLADDFDLANGYATVLGRNTVALYAAQPEAASTISNIGDWLELVFVHEYAHILTLDYRRGYAAAMEAVFGRVDMPYTPVSALFWLLAVPPNGLLPPWAVEGMAVDFESGVTGRGRAGSTWYDTVNRAAVAEDAIPPLDRLGGEYPSWPSYDTRYIFGARLMSRAAGKGGLEKLGELARESGGRFPFFIEGAAEKVSGRDYPTLYAEMVAELKEAYGAEIGRIKDAGLTPFSALTIGGGALGAPRWIGDDKIAYTEDSPHRQPMLKVLEVATGRATTVAERTGSLARPTVGADGRLVYAALAAERPWAGPNLRGALYAADPSGRGWPVKLTDGLRVRYADALPGGGGFAAVELEGTDQRLSLLVPKEGGGFSERVLLAETNVRYDDPAVSPDGRLIAFTRKTPEGGERLALIPTEGGEAALVTPASCRSLSPSWTPDGRAIVYSSDEGGVFNLHALELATQKSARLTNVVAGAFAPAVSPDGKRIAFLSYSSRGFDLAVTENPAAPAYADKSDREAPSPAKRAEAPAPVSAPYSALPYLLPTYWLPDLQADNAGLVYGAWTSARDPLDTLSFVAGGFWSQSNERPYGVAALTWDGWYPTITLSAWKSPLLYSGLLGDYDWWEESRGAALDVRQFFTGAESLSYLALGLRVEDAVRLSRIGEDLDGNGWLAELPFTGRRDAVYAEIGLDTTPGRSSLFNVAPEGGRRLFVNYTVRDEALGADLNSREARAGWTEYFGFSWPERWVFSLAGRGGVGRGDATLQSLFQAGGPVGDFPLRGYPSRTLRAEKLGTASAELALPLFSPYRGAGDWPAYFMRADAAVFADSARAWDTPTGIETRRAAGAELRFAGLLGYYAPTVITLGYAKGFDEDGESKGYLLVAVGGQTLYGAGTSDSINRR